MSARKGRRSQEPREALVVRYRLNGGPWQARHVLPVTADSEAFLTKLAERRALALEGNGREVEVNRVTA